MTKKPWPADALIVVASVAGQEKREQMESVVHKTCRDCDAVLAADSFTIRRAENHPQRYGRQVQFLCVPCSVRYDVNTVDVFEDHRTAEGKAIAIGG